MGNVYLRNTNPLGHVDLRLIGREGEADDVAGTGCLIPGEVFAVDEKVAGVAPHWRPVADEDDPLAEEIREGRCETRRVPIEDPEEDGPAEQLEVWDLGHGLLAQVGNYELADGPNDGLDKHKIPELKELAAKRGIDLGDATKKDDILAAIRKAATR